MGKVWTDAEREDMQIYLNTGLSNADIAHMLNRVHHNEKPVRNKLSVSNQVALKRSADKAKAAQAETMMCFEDDLTINDGQMPRGWV